MNSSTKPKRAVAIVVAAAFVGLFGMTGGGGVFAEPAMDFDARGERENARFAPAVSPLFDQSQTLDALRDLVEGELQVRWSRFTAAPSRIHRRGATLTPPSTASPQSIANDFLTRYRKLFNLSEQDTSQTRLTRNYRTLLNGVTHLTLQQQSNGIDVIGAGMQINVDALGRILNVSGEMIPNVHESVNATDPVLTEDAAVARAAASAGVEEYTGPAVHGLVYYPRSPIDVRLAWKVSFDDVGSPDTFESLVDAVDGTVLWRKNLTEYDHFPAHGTVYTSDSPIPQTPKGTAAPAARQDVPFNGSGFFPHDDPHYDWWAGGPRTTTTSNNVDAYADRDGDNVPDAGSRPTAGAGEDFTFPIDLTMDPSTYNDAAVANLFYWNNRIHDWLYQMGFDEASGNFQTNNFGLGGLGGDPVMAEAQDNRDGKDPSLCNANFGTPADGSSPRMQMFQCDSAVPERDGDLDNVVIGHEYGHGVHSRLVSTSGNQRGNEGWSDYFGLSLIAEPDDPYDGAYGIADYLFNGNGDGIRSKPYSTDLSIFTRTYADINDASTSCQVKTCSEDDTKVCTEDADCTGTCDALVGCKFHEDCQPPNTTIDQSPCRSQVHRTGELWANALWNMRMNLIGKWGYGAGDPTANRLVIDGMKLSPADPTFLDGRDAILTADLANNGGANECLIWDAFAKMGMGFSAQTTGVLDLNPVEAFNVPTGCAPVLNVNAPSEFGTVCEGDSSTNQLTIFNTGGGDLIVNTVEVTSGSSDISVDPLPELPAFLSPDAHVDFTVRCEPTSSGSKTATVTIESNDPGSPLEIEYTCEGGSAKIVTTLDADYGEVCLGDSLTNDLFIRNTGTCDLTVNPVAVVDADNEFAIATVMVFPLVIAPGTEATVPIEFTPEGNFGGAAAEVRITHDGTNVASPKVLSVVGNSPPPDINVAIADEGNFGDVCKGNVKDLNLTLFNQGPCDLTISNIELVGADPDQFELPDDLTFPLILSHDADFNLPVRFSPDDCFDVPKTAQVKITSDDPDENMVLVDISGTSPCPNLVIDPAGLTGIYAFPATVIDPTGNLGCFTQRSIVLRNTGACPLTIDSVTAMGISGDALDFAVTAPTLFPIVLPAGEETLASTVRFTPQADADPLAPSEVLGLFEVVSDDPDYLIDPATGQAALCGESAAQSGVRILVTDITTGDPVPVDEVDAITIQSKGKNRPGPVNLRFTDQPMTSTSVCGNTVDYHVDQETLPSTGTTGGNPQSSYESKASEGNLQASESFGLGQCEFREFQLQLQSSSTEPPGDCLLLPKGDSCASDGECCSGKCRGPAGDKTCK